MELCCPCLFGLESVLAGEIKRMGGQEVTVTDGKVMFRGGPTELIRANLNLRTAERVLIVLGRFSAVSFEQLFEQTAALPFEEFIGRDDAFPVKGWSLQSALHSVPDCQSIIKKAAVRRLEGVYGIKWFSEEGPPRQIQFSIHRDEVMIMLDTSGPGLHKRGYREQSAVAPIKETLAAGIIDIAHVRRDDLVIDPFCGSGTFLIEAALHAFRIPPGLRRRFAAERWGLVPDSVWAQERERARESIVRSAKYRGMGCDIDPAAVRLSAQNAEKAGVGAKISFAVRDIASFKPPDERATVICNPPYGERLGDLQAAEALYREMGRAFAPGECNYYIISPHEDFEQLFGRRATKRRKLYNGMIKCQLFMYYDESKALSR